MADKTGIEWTDSTWNPVTGCAKVSQGCKNCYALRDWPRMSANPNTVYYGREFTDVRCHRERLEQPIRWKKPRMIFANSMSDLFHESVPDEFIDSVFAVMAIAEQHTFQVLTKRPERMLRYMSTLHSRSQEIAQAAMYVLNGKHWTDGDSMWDCVAHRIEAGSLPNVWLGVSVEDQATADERIPLLLQTPAAVRWISAEPLLGPVDLDRVWLDYEGDTWLDWVVAGGESGQKARPMHPDWVRLMRDQCAAAGVPFLFKQWGEWAPRSSCYHTLTNGMAAADVDPGATQWPCIRLTPGGKNGRDLANVSGGDDCYMQKVGKKLAGRLFMGQQHDGYPIGKPA